MKNHKSKHANDRLIAAAPDLLASLVTLSEWMRENTGPRDGTQEMLSRAQAVIAACSSADASDPDPEIRVPDDGWTDAPASEEESPPRSRLLQTIAINGTFHHLEAIEVQVDSDGVQCAVDPAMEESLTGYYLAAGGEGPMETVTIRGKRYCLFASPHCD